MPLRNGIPHCVNHPDKAMTRNEGLSAVVTVTRDHRGTTFNPSSGVPLVVYYCDSCGYTELYVAQKTSFWTSEISQHRTPSIERALRFESLVIHALAGLTNRYPRLHITQDVRVSGSDPVQIDAILRNGDKVAIVEVKAATSRTNLGLAAGQVRHALERYLDHQKLLGVESLVRPVIIAPASPEVPPDVLGVPIMTFDLATETFTDLQVLDWLLTD